MNRRLMKIGGSEPDSQITRRGIYLHPFMKTISIQVGPAWEERMR